MAGAANADPPLAGQPSLVVSAPAEARPAAVPGEVLVRFRPGVRGAARSRASRGAGVRVVEGAAPPGVAIARVEAGVSTAAALADLEGDPSVVWAEPNRYRQPAGVPDDPLFPQLWAQQNLGQTVNGFPGTLGADIDAVPAWALAAASGALTPAGAGPIVAVVDTGVAYDHPDLASRIATNPGETGGGRESNGLDDDGNGLVDDWRGWDWVDDDNDPRDSEGHGTHVAGTIGARAGDGFGVSGVAGPVRLLPLRVLGPQGGTDADIAAAFDYAARQGARIVNASLGGPGSSQVLEDAIAAHPETLFVVAAGNSAADNDAAPDFPCASPAPNLVCVAATDQDDALAEFSSYGAASVDLGAPGTNVLSASPAHDGLFEEGFEAGQGAWSTGGTAPWGLTGAASSAGAFSLADSPAGPYANGARSWARLAQPLDLSGRAGCRVFFDARLDTEPGWDFLDVQASSDGVSWTTVQSATGSSGGSFIPMDAGLSALDGRTTAYVRFLLDADASVTGGGVEIDEVRIGCATATSVDGEFRYASGTSMATPHVAGAAALIAAAAPGLGAQELKAALLGGVEPQASLAGRTVSGGRLNAFRALTMALGTIEVDPPGPAPEPDPEPPPPPPVPRGIDPVIPEAEQPGPVVDPGAPVVVAPVIPPVQELAAPPDGERVSPRLRWLGVRTAGGPARRAAARRVVAFRLSETARVKLTVLRWLKTAKGPRLRPVRKLRARTLRRGLRKVALGPLAAGRYRIVARLADGAGNRSTAARTVRLR